MYYYMWHVIVRRRGQRVGKGSEQYLWCTIINHHPLNTEYSNCSCTEVSGTICEISNCNAGSGRTWRMHYYLWHVIVMHRDQRVCEGSERYFWISIINHHPSTAAVTRIRRMSLVLFVTTPIVQGLYGGFITTCDMYYWGVEDRECTQFCRGTCDVQ